MYSSSTYVSTLMQRLSRRVRRWGGQQCYSSSITAEAAHTQHPTHRHTTQASTTYSSTAARTAAVREYVHAEVVSCIVLGFPCFYDPPPHRGPRTAPFDASRAASLALGPVLSPIIPCALWGGRGGGARENRSKTGNSKTHPKVKVQNGTATKSVQFSYQVIRILHMPTYQHIF